MKTLHQYYYYNKVLPIGTSINVEVEVEKVFSTPLRSSLAKGGLSVAFAGLLPLYYQYHFFSYLLHPSHLLCKESDKKNYIQQTGGG